MKNHYKSARHPLGEYTKLTGLYDSQSSTYFTLLGDFEYKTHISLCSLELQYT